MPRFKCPRCPQTYVRIGDLTNHFGRSPECYKEYLKRNTTPAQPESESSEDNDVNNAQLPDYDAVANVLPPLPPPPANLGAAPRAVMDKDIVDGGMHMPHEDNVDDFDDDMMLPPPDDDDDGEAPPPPHSLPDYPDDDDDDNLSLASREMYMREDEQFFSDDEQISSDEEPEPELFEDEVDEDNCGGTKATNLLVDDGVASALPPPFPEEDLSGKHVRLKPEGSNKYFDGRVDRWEQTGLYLVVFGNEAQPEITSCYTTEEVKIGIRHYDNRKGPRYEGVLVRHPFTISSEDQDVYFNGEVKRFEMFKACESDTFQTPGWRAKFEDGEYHNLLVNEVLDGIDKHEEYRQEKLADPSVTFDRNLPAMDNVRPIIDEYRKRCNANSRGVPGGPPLPRDVSAAKLLVLLEKHHAHQILYDDIAKWFREEAVNVRRFHRPGLPGRLTIISTLARRYNMKGMYPKEVKVFLPNLGKNIFVPVYDFASILASWFTDPSLLKDENFVFPDPEDPFQPPKKWTEINKETQIVKEPVHGKWYSDTYYARCTVGKKDLLVPLILFLDKTHIDQKNRQKLEPVMVTLGIFSQKVRTDPKYWRVLGYIPYIQSGYPSGTGETNLKLSDYHVMLSSVLRGVKEMQKTQGVLIRFPYRNKTHEAIFKMPVACIVGDHEGQNHNCGKLTAGTIFPCRFCDIHKDKLDQPIIGEPYSAKDVMEWLVTKNTKALVGSSHHYLTHGNAFHGMDMGADEERGINKKAEVDIMHSVCRGTMQMTIENLSNELKPDRNQWTKKFKSSQKGVELSITSGPPESDELSVASDSSVGISGIRPKRYKSNRRKGKGRGKRKGRDGEGGEDKESAKRVLSNKVALMVDKATIYWGKLLTHQSVMHKQKIDTGEKSLGKVWFPSGVATGATTNYTCLEMPGVLLLYVILLASTIGTQFFETPPSEEHLKRKLNDNGYSFDMDSERTADYIWAFESLVLMYYMLKSDVMTVAFVEDYLAPYIGLFMQRFVQRVSRSSGNNWRTLKFHSMMHLPQMLVELGNATVTDSETGERTHMISKAQARNTQKVADTISYQTGRQHGNHAIICRAEEEFCTEKKPVSIGDNHVVVELRKFCFDANFEMQWYDPIKNKGPVKWHDEKLRNSVQQFLRAAIGNKSAGANFIYCTEARVDSQLYRANPVFHSTARLGRGWHDMAMVRKRDGSDGSFPVNLLGFIEVEQLTGTFDINTRHMPSAYRPKQRVTVSENSILALVHELKPKAQKVVHSESILLSNYYQNGKKYQNREKIWYEPYIFLVLVNDISGTCVGVPDLIVRERRVPNRLMKTTFEIMEHPHLHYILIRSRKEWPELYRELIIKEMDKIEGRPSKRARA
jgi:hypothetical protein